ncbi:unnamed protein product [Onchocerca flexuosa]|uniref:Reverse transcriptase domain-containing protein n=1 Tax=Onchocerca flexuosa TaxID=387005 RepID=A0A183HD29_9BILA|nr:unnamed protein product [Onchocerca flexuosa]
MNLHFAAEIYDEELIMIEDLCSQMANEVPNQLGIPSPNRSASASYDVDCIANKITIRLTFSQTCNQIFLSQV